MSARDSLLNSKWLLPLSVGAATALIFYNSPLTKELAQSSLDEDTKIETLECQLAHQRLQTQALLDDLRTIKRDDTYQPNGVDFSMNTVEEPIDTVGKLTKSDTNALNESFVTVTDKSPAAGWSIFFNP